MVGKGVHDGCQTLGGLNRMPHSMTGFSTAEEAIPPFRVVWEIRSVNHRFLELSFRMPDELRAKLGW